MGLRKGQPVPALVVPDEETWLVWSGGRELCFEPTTEPGRARVLLLSVNVPHALVPAVQAAWALMANTASVATYDAPLPGIPAATVIEDANTASDEDADARHEHHGEPLDVDGDGDAGEPESHGAHGADGGDDHGDMMAITDKPSADGLVMESLDVQAGPLGVALPGGLVVAAELDGDVVAECNVDQTLRANDAGAPPDVWASVAWSVAQLAAQEPLAGLATRPEGRWFRLAAVEVERAVAQFAWLHQFLRLLAWPHMTNRVRALLLALVRARGALPVEVTTPDLPDIAARDVRGRLLDVHSESQALAGDLAKSRLFARRTTGLGHLSHDDAARRGVSGPNARACGLRTDARGDDPGYRSLGFTPVVREDGDARARALTRTEEAAQSSGMAAAALERAHRPAQQSDIPTFAASGGGLVESARGPVRVLTGDAGQLHRTAPGARAACDAAGELAVGREWAAALVTVASFDISPWRVGR